MLLSKSLKQLIAESSKDVPGFEGFQAEDGFIGDVIQGSRTDASYEELSPPSSQNPPYTQRFYIMCGFPINGDLVKPNNRVIVRDSPIDTIGYTVKTSKKTFQLNLSV